MRCTTESLLEGVPSLAILVLVTSINEYMLFVHVNPVRTVELPEAEFVEELSQLLGKHLSGN